MAANPEQAMEPPLTYTILQLGYLDDSGDSLHRIRWPGRQIARQAPHWRVINLSMEAEERYAWAERADLLILYQSHDLDLLPVIEKRRAQGLKTLAEYNGNFYDPPPTSNAAEAWRSPLIWQSYESIMKACDALIVTGPGLEALFSSKVTGEIFIIENHCPEEPEPFEKVWMDPDGTFNLGWAGSSGHMADVLSILPILRRLMGEFPHLRLHLMGNAFFHDYPGLDNGRVEFRPWGSMDDYFDFLSPLHLGLVPMIDNEYNRCRSDIKAIEMGSRGVLPLLPDRLPYRGILSGIPLEPCTSTQALYERIAFYLNHPDHLREDARRLHGYICQHRVGSRRGERLALYRRMLPKTPMDGAWPLPPGFHEIQGSSAPYAPTLDHTRNAAALCAEGKWREALDLARQLQRGNPAHPDLALLELRILVSAQGRAGDWRTPLRAAQSRFPLDLRFDLLELRVARSSEERATLWSRLLTRLEKESAAFRAYHEQEITALMETGLQSDQGLLEAADRLLSLYPQALALMQKAALAHESRGDCVKAKDYFQEIAAAKEALSQDSAFLEKIDGKWLETWCSALQERVGNSTRGEPPPV